MRVIYRRIDRDSIELEVYGETHTVLNLLTSYLNTKLVEGYSAYRVEHPLKQDATLYVNAGGGGDAKELLLEAVKSLIEDLQSLRRKLDTAAGKA
ncbi:MAG: RpoL/Rpb11 RNA polymerase subunit family protein [Thermoproteota archaeon]